MASSLITRRVFIVSVLLVTLGSLVSISNARCEFEAIFNFGDSNSDNGGFYAAFPSQSGPYGMTNFKTPSGRASDGRLIIDFLAQAIGIPFLSPYLQSIGSNYKHGANFATAASTVLQPSTSIFVSGISPFYLNVQLNQMKLLKAKVDHDSSDQLPSADIFGKSLYTFNIGQNDFTSNLASVGISGVRQRILKLLIRSQGLLSYNFDPQVQCGNSKVISGNTVTATACEDPYHYVSWDGVHTTEAANKQIAQAIVSGSYLDPPFALKDHCDIQPIG
ncbi:hypothetical protein ACHQM5_011709 [Ranunculus cassubicifolius]